MFNSVKAFHVAHCRKCPAWTAITLKKEKENYKKKWFDTSLDALEYGHFYRKGVGMSTISVLAYLSNEHNYALRANPDHKLHQSLFWRLLSFGTSVLIRKNIRPNFQTNKLSSHETTSSPYFTWLRFLHYFYDILTSLLFPLLVSCVMKL